MTIATLFGGILASLLMIVYKQAYTCEKRVGGDDVGDYQGPR